MTLNKFEFSENFSEFRIFRTQQQLNECLDQYCQRQRCKHVELEQFLCFRVAQVCQRQLGFLVSTALVRAAVFDGDYDAAKECCRLVMGRCRFLAGRNAVLTIALMLPCCINVSVCLSVCT